MITESPPHGAANDSLSARVTVHLEVPDASGRSNDELRHAHDECIDPEEHEDLVEGNVASIFIPLHLGEELVFGSGRRISNRKHEDCAHEPYTEPDHADEVSKQGQEEDPQVRGNELGCRLVDRDSQSDCAIAAADAAEEKACDSPNTIGCILQPVFVVAVLVLWRLRLIPNIVTAGEEGRLQQNDCTPDQDGTDQINQEQVQVGQDEGRA